ncbi:cytochrome P450 4C1-like [Polistes fuscatus]|uniref:cytochrome P450 4C1-like n=1 Tax=Polistes fuscatus TaxID=30207 RepID=UPI001CA812C2|nr:cytochrome P450 4C1-like [Polistes fuscatus]
MAKDFSGPKAYLLIGNLNVFLGDLIDITHNLMKLFANNSSPWLLWLGPKLVLIFDDPESIEGSDTATNTLSFLFLMLATFSDIQNQVYEELYDLYSSSDPKDVAITMEDIKKMKYLDRVIKETLRLFPPALVIGRTLKRDTKVNDNVIIPKNCHVVFAIFSLHRKDKYWNDPSRFNPDRFLLGNYNPKCFIPFSLGLRGCIGQIFDMTKMEAIAASLLRKFTVRINDPVSVQNVNIKFRITSQTTETKFLRFNKR